MNTTTTTSNLHREFNEHLKLAYWIIHRRLRQKLGRYDDELVGEAIAQAWSQFARCRQRVADPAHAVALVARSGAARALRGSRFVKREPGYVDAMDVRGRAALDRLAARGEKLRHPADRGFVDPADLVARPENVPADALDGLPLDRSHVEGMIALLPSKELQVVARWLSYGTTQAQIAIERGVSKSTISRQMNEIEIWFRAMGFSKRG